MKREFRAWNGRSMEYGGFSIHATGKVVGIADGLSDVKENSPVMQYIGLKDENGKKIFVGDILNSLHNEIGVVCYEAPYFKAWDVLRGSYSFNSAEIIGNTFENPELVPKG